jgi:flagellin-specific chaperone FliS
MKELENENIKFESLNMVLGIIDELIRALDKEAEEILKGLSKYKEG